MHIFFNPARTSTNPGFTAFAIANQETRDPRDLCPLVCIGTTADPVAEVAHRVFASFAYSMSGLLLLDQNDAPIITFQTASRSHEGHSMLASTHHFQGVRYSDMDIFDLRTISGLLDCGGTRHPDIRAAWYAVYKDLAKAFTAHLQLDEDEEAG